MSALFWPSIYLIIAVLLLLILLIFVRIGIYGCKVHLFWFIQIVNWRTHLKFPEEAKLSLEAKNLISKLLCNVDQRLGTKGADEIKVSCGVFYSRFSNLLLQLDWKLLEWTSWNCYFQAHSWFKGVEWDKLYQMKAAFIPEVNDELDTQNFEKFEEVDI